MLPDLITRNQIETPEQRLARQIETLREITELSLRLARQAAAVAEAFPGDPSQAAKPRPSTHPSLVFERLVRAIRANIALEIRLAGHNPPAPRSEDAAPPADAADPGLTGQDDLSLIGRLSRHDRRALAKRLRTVRP
jgi:hypothetical protein